MAVDITIQQTGVAENYTGTAQIVVPSAEGSDTEWVPQAESQMGVKKITKNGTYFASSDNLKGYLGVFIAVPATQITGMDKTDGKHYTIKVDEFGNILKIPID